MRQISDKALLAYRQYLINEEKSNATLKKYLTDVEKFGKWLCGAELDKSLVLRYKEYLAARYAPASVNTVIAALNSFFSFNEWYDLRIKSIKIQRQIFSEEALELTKNEYECLLQVAKEKSERLYLLMQTICATGIRVSELCYITVDAVKRGHANINCKGKRRTVFLTHSLCRLLKKYIKLQNIKGGSVFVTKNGLPLDRSNIWSAMKKLCCTAKVSEKKVFPHNLRHLFARTFYAVNNDIVRLADILGHSSINTTRIYTMESGYIHKKQLEKLGLLRC